MQAVGFFMDGAGVRRQAAGMFASRRSERGV